MGGSHSHAGPANQRRTHRQQSDASLTSNSVTSYRLSSLYAKGLIAYESKAALDRFNGWVETHAADIDPALAKVCHLCGSADLILCDHNIVRRGDEIVTQTGYAPEVPLRTTHFWSYHLWDSLKQAMNWPKFDLSAQNNRDLAGFDNGDVTDDNIIPELYNYVKLRMQTSYAVNGVDNRPLRLEHCRRLASKWCESRNLEKRAEENTLLTNRIMFTIQRVCDNIESRVMYEYTDPAQNFLLARLPILKSWPKLLILTLLYVAYGRFIMFALPHIILYLSTYIVPGAVGRWASLLDATCRLLLSGSQHVFLGLIISPFTLIGAISLLIALITISLLWKSRRH